MSEYPDPVWVTTELLSAPDTSGVLRPGDTLIIRVKPERPTQLVVEMVEAAERALPDVKVICVAADGFAIYRPDPPNTKAES